MLAEHRKSRWAGAPGSMPGGEIDNAGKELLRQMFASGVEFVVAAHATSSRIN